MKSTTQRGRLPESSFLNYSRFAKKIGCLAFSSALLIACGGGGGNSDPQQEEPNPTPPPTDEPEATPTPEPEATPTPEPDAPLAANLPPSRSSTIAITSDDRRVVLANREKNTVSIIEVKDAAGADTENLIAELAVGNEPRYVVISPDNTTAYVSNTVDATVSEISLTGDAPSVVGTPINVGSEPRGLALSPNGTYLYVANFTSSTVSVISTANRSLVNTFVVGGNPMAITVSNDQDGDDTDETVYVVRYFSAVIDPDNRPDGFNDSKAGKVAYLSVADSLTSSERAPLYTIDPLADAGFAADRRAFCQNTRDALQAQPDGTVFFNSGPDEDGNGAAALKSDIFCPDNNATDAGDDAAIANTPQGAYVNNLFSVVLRNNKLFLPNIGASPEPPVRFNVNIQALLSFIDLSNGANSTINLNDQIKAEAQPENETASLDRLFGNDIVAIDADASGNNALIVSRGGNYVIRANINAQGVADIGAPNNVVRFKTGNIPNGVVMNSDGTRAYTNNEVSTSVSAIDLANNQVLAQDIPASEPPAPGTQEHRDLLGKLVFYTALGTPDVFDTNGDGEFDINVRDIDPLAFRGKASDNAWSSCASCHEDGHSDNVTWIFPTGPRQTVPLEGTFAKGDLDDQRILNWNAVRGSVTDFNNNSRGVQGGIGFATDVNGENKTTQVFNHGPTRGISDALDAMTEWMANVVRAPIMPDVANSGRETFITHCSACHNGVKWTKSSIALYDNNPTFAENPIGNNFFQNLLPIDPNLTVAGPQISAVNINGDAFNFLENVGTLFDDNDLEIRGAGAIAGQSTQGFAALSAAGAFNVPSLLGVGISSPYLHNGSAETIGEVFSTHRLPASQNLPINQVITEQDALDNLAVFVLIIDEQTPTVP
ncbi:MAG: YncE family protein [Cellvibrionaceae bacterium]|nr:YncE family protein [Cellvibrionaceae bacterium]